ncbi:hypothetical protein C1646_756572 [Rhizophagus diaphanus]|nr:hypothetical protein C1646_756572 [Rhizophagus diaphanus] [Rhizophagus sp. MUCL 43196]
MDTKMILSLINRIGSKLPCKSGKKLETLEADGLIQQFHTQTYKDLPSNDVLQSQLFILKILSECMTNHWKFCQGTSVESLSKETSTKESLNTSNTSSSTNSLNTSNTPNTSSSSNLSFKLPKSWDDLPPLDDNLAVFILKVLSRFLYQMDSLKDYNPNVHNGPSGGKESPNHNVQAAWSPATYELVSEIFKSTRRVTFYIERSNSAIVQTNPPFVSICQSAGHDIITSKKLKGTFICEMGEMEADVLIQHIVNAIIDLSRFKFGTIDQTFRKYLEGTSVESPSKETSNHYTSNTSSPTSSSSPLNASNTPNTSSSSNPSFKLPRS